MSRIVVIPNAVEDENPAGELRPTDQDRVVLLHVGHLCAAKGTPTLLEAFARLPRQSGRIVLRLVGECIAPYSCEALQRDIDRLGLQDFVEVTGVLRGAALSAQYRAASLFVFPSVAIYESFGLVLAEAMMWGLPIVASDWRANAEVVGRPCGGVLYELGPDPIASLHGALEQALAQSEHWPEWAKQNRKRYEEFFMIHRFAEDWIRLFSAELQSSEP